MTDNPNNYCSIPRIFGNRFSNWYNVKFGEICHIHDIAYGNQHPKTGTRKQADDAYREGLTKLGYPILAFVIWKLLRTFGWIYWQQSKH